MDSGRRCRMQIGRKDIVTIYTDGACRGNPGPGGWAAIVIQKDETRELKGASVETTNNRMELTAPIEGLKGLTVPSCVEIITDSQYVSQGITEWIRTWKRRSWRTASNKPVKNVDLWQMLDAEVIKHEVKWRWVKGHSGDPGNERADELANIAIDELIAGEK